MNTILNWRLSCLVSLTALLVGNGLSAQAETINKTTNTDNSPIAVNLQPITTAPSSGDMIVVASTPEKVAKSTIGIVAAPTLNNIVQPTAAATVPNLNNVVQPTVTAVAIPNPDKLAQPTSGNDRQQSLQATVMAPQLTPTANVTPIEQNTIAPTPAPVPGKSLTSASVLLATPKNVAQASGTTPSTDTPSGNTPGITAPSQTQPNLITPGNAPGPTAPTNNPTDIAPGSKTRGGSSYVGLAGNIGLSGGETSLGVGSFTIISKIGLLRNISFRPTAVIGDNSVVLLPLTYDFSLQRESVLSKAFRISPYIGAGLAINTGDNSDTGALITAGVDVPLTRQFTATAGLNVGFINNTSIGLLLGVGYNFSGFFGL